jgi:PAS domain S-box-containing protein
MDGSSHETDPEALLARLLEAVPGGVVHVGPDGGVRRANPAARAFLGYSYDELTRRYTQDFAGDTWFEDGSRCGHGDYPVAITLTTGQPAGPTTIGVRQPDGEVRWAVFRSVPVEGGGAVVTFLDITERRAAEIRLRTSDRLASLGRLAAGVAHEINNPLTWVMLNLDRALDESEPADAIQRALEGLKRVASIVRDLGAVARVDDTEPMPFDVHPAIEQALAVAQAEVQHRAELIFRRGVDVPLAFGHASRAVQIVLNLLLNAAQAIPPGNRQGNRILVETRGLGRQVCVLVRDTGVGMAPSIVERAFDPFFTTKAPGEGTGLGLAISHALASAMQGSIELESAQGQGTTVRFVLPAADGVAPMAPPVDPPVDGPPPARVLVCDDEPEITHILVWALAPHVVEVASSGREARERLANGSYDLLICDLMMPEITGMTLHADLMERWPDLAGRTLFVTGGAYTDEARTFLERPDVRSIRKPFRVAEIRRIVADMLDISEPTPRSPAGARRP